MSALGLIPAQYQLAARLVALLVLAAACFAGGWTINGWRLGTEVADLKTAHAQAIVDATARTLAALRKADADHAQLAGSLAALDARYHQDLTKEQHANDSLRADVAAGRRIVRVAATCPGRPAGVPEAAASGSVDPGAGAVLGVAAGEAVLDLRADAIRVGAKLAACQAAVRAITGQP